MSKVELPLDLLSVQKFPLYDSLVEMGDRGTDTDMSHLSEDDQKICAAIILHYHTLHDPTDTIFYNATAGTDGLSFETENFPRELKCILCNYAMSKK